MSTAEGVKNKRFMKLLKYEVNNRMMAFISMGKLADKQKGKAAGPFWQAYVELEDLNQKIYAPIAKQYGLSMEVTFGQRFAAGLWLGFSALFPEFALRSISESTIKYVSDLEEMERLAPKSDDKAFYRYVVDQEKVQSDGMVLVREGKEAEAARIMADFLKGFSEKAVA